MVEVILEGGLPGFSVQEVADRAGVSHRTVYRHFPPGSCTARTAATERSRTDHG